eukprot:UN12833
MAEAEEIGAGAGATGEGCVVSDGDKMVLKFAKPAHFSIVDFGNDFQEFAESLTEYDSVGRGVAISFVADDFNLEDEESITKHMKISKR